MGRENTQPEVLRPFSWLFSQLGEKVGSLFFVIILSFNKLIKIIVWWDKWGGRKIFLACTD
jgi:hypothetical protein